MAIGPRRGFFPLLFRRLLAVAVAFVSLSPLASVPAAATTAVGDTLVITGHRRGDLSLPHTAGLLTRVDLTQHPVVGDLSRVLAGVAGLQMARLGGWGATAIPSLRGSSPAQIRFFLDGIPLPDAQTGLAGFSQVPLDRLQAVEVYRGGVPASLGGLGGAGAINFVSRSQPEGVAVVSELGSFGERGARVSTGITAADQTRTAMVMIHGHRAANDFLFRDHRQTFNRTDDDTVRVRRNADLVERGAWGQFRWRRRSLLLQARLGYNQRSGGRPGPLGFPSTRARVSYDRGDGSLHVDWRRGLLRLDVAAGRGHESLIDPFGEVGFAPPGTTRTVSDDFYTRLVWSPDLLIGGLGLKAGLVRRSQRQIEITAARTDPARARHTTSTFAALIWDVSDRLQVEPSWRWQRTVDDFPGVPVFPWLPAGAPVDNHRDDISPAVAAVWSIVPGALLGEAHAARTVRVPTWVELFGHRGGVDGNRALQAEVISAADLGVTIHRRERWTARLAVFYAATEAKIIFVQNSQRTSKAMNLGRTESRGGEGELKLALATGWDLRGNITVQRVVDRGLDPAYRNNRVPFLPDVEAHLRLTGRSGPWSPWLSVEAMSANYRDRANTDLDQAPARTLWHLGLTREWRLRGLGTVATSAEIINLTDNAIYDVEGFPLPGRSWHLSFRIGS